MPPPVWASLTTFVISQPKAMPDLEKMPHGTEPKPLASMDIPLHLAVDLTQGGFVAHIQHQGQVYALRITKQEKLILTK